MVDTSRSGLQSTADKNQKESKIYANHTVAAKPLDFSFLKITNVACKLIRKRK